MALQIGQTQSVKVKFITTLMMVLALAVQPLYSVISYGVANALQATTLSYDFHDYDGSTNWGSDWTFDGTKVYKTAGSCGAVANCVEFDKSGASATLSLPLATSQTAQTLGFHLQQNTTSTPGDSSLTLTQYNGATSLGATTYTTGANDVALNAATNKLVFTSTKVGNNLALDDVVVALKNAEVTPTLAPCAVTDTLKTTDMATWYTADTQAGGQFNLTDSGLHMSTSTDAKVAGYYYFSAHSQANVPLRDACAPSIDINPGFSGTRPSLQLTVDHNGDGKWYGNLVYEPWSYGEGNYWSSKDFGISSGMGYKSFGTLQDYLNANPNTTILAVGYSLGSGVNGDATIAGLTVGNTRYSFEAPALPVANARTHKTFATIQAAIDDPATTNGDTLELNEDMAIPDQVNVNKKITLDGQGHTLSVSGTGYRILVTADGTTLENLAITKTDTVGVQNIVGVQANNVTIDHVNFTGQFNIGDGDTSRALEVSSVSNLTVKNSSFKHLRQPAYINTATGTFSDNYTSDTKGWVLVANSNIHFTGNTWGTNVTDLAVIDDDANAATPITNNYTCSVMAQIKADNNNATIDNQVQTGSCDTTAPSVPTLLSPVDRGYTKTNDFYFDWTDSTDNNPGVTYEFQSSLNSHTTSGVLDTNVWKSGVLNASTIHSTGAPDGTWYWQVRAIDAAGNTSAWTPVWRMTIDTHAPTNAITTPTSGQYVSTRQSGNILTVTGSASDNIGLNRVLIQLLTSKHGAIENHTVYLSGTDQNWSTTFDVKQLGLSDGVYSIVAMVTDNAGSTSTEGQYVDFTLDNTKPTAKFTSDTSSPTPNGYYNGDITVGYSVADNLKLKSVNVSLRDAHDTTGNQWRANCYDNQAETSADDTGTCMVHLPAGLPDGEYYIQIGGQDAAGNWTVNATRTISVDRTPPSIIHYAYSNNGNLTKDDVTVTITTSEPVQTPVGWTEVDATHFTKVFEHNGGFYVGLADIVGNTAIVGGKADGAEVKRIDKNAPEISGVTSGDTVDGAVTLSIFDPTTNGYADGFDKNHGLTINGHEAPTTEVAGKKYEATVTDPGVYTIVATDKAGNATQLKFTLAAKNDTTTPGAGSTGTDTTGGGSSTSNNSGSSQSASSDSAGGANLAGTRNRALLATLNGTNGQFFAGDTTQTADTQGNVLGTSDASKSDMPAVHSDDKGQVKGDSTTAWNLFGFAWYWWLLLLAAIAGIIWWIAAARRRSNEA